MKREQFLKIITAFPIIAAMDNLDSIYATNSPNDLLIDENFWLKIRSQFYLDEHSYDFRSHAASALPINIVKHFTKEFNYIQAFPSLRNKEIEPGNKEPLRLAVAQEINSSVAEIAIMRSTTEALNNAIMGFPFKKGDEVIVSEHEYDSMIGSLYQLQQKIGITIKKIDIPYQPTSTEEIITLYKKSITSNTKMFLVSHIVWISGVIYPIKEICKLAKEHNIYTIIDAAQSFSHIPINVKDIDCDYLGASLHKWAAAPLGTGFLYIKKKNIPLTTPLFGHYNYKPYDDEIEKFENFGSFTPIFNSAALSIAYWNKLGTDLKTKRMQYLKEYWTSYVKALQEVIVLTDINPSNSCGIAYFTIKNRSSKEVASVLKSKYNILVQAIENYKNDYVDYKNVNAIGVATPVFVTKKQLDYFNKAIAQIVKNK